MAMLKSLTMRTRSYLGNLWRNALRGATAPSAVAGAFTVSAVLLAWLVTGAPQVQACPGSGAATDAAAADVPCGIDAEGNAAAYTLATLTYDVVDRRVVMADVSGLDGAAEKSGAPVTLSVGDGMVTVEGSVRLAASVAETGGVTHVVETLAICN
jgi:hypothetical protein